MKNNDPFCITGWGREGITDPMEAVAEIFSYMDMGGWRRLITKMAAHALSGKYTTGGHPAMYWWL